MEIHFVRIVVDFTIKTLFLNVEDFMDRCRKLLKDFFDRCPSIHAT